MSLSRAPLIEVAGRIGIDADDIRRAEQPSRLRHTFTVRGNSLANLRAEDVTTLQQTYGTSLNVEIRLGELTDLTVDATTQHTEVEEFLDRLVQTNEYEIVIDLNKEELVENELTIPNGWQVYWFLFTATIEEMLRRGISHFESQVWTGEDSRLMLLISDEDFKASGSFLHVFGAGHLGSSEEALAEPDPDWSMVKHMKDARDRYISWEHAWVEHLTPLHFDLAVDVGAGTALDGLLVAQAVKLTVLFTCDRARFRPRAGRTAEIRAEFRGQQYSTVVPIDEEMPLGAVPDASMRAMNRLVIWCYRRETGELERDWVQNRLPFVQTRVAETLAVVEEDARLESFARFVPYLLDGLDWQWKAFIEDRVSEYLTKVRQLEGVVERAVAAFARRTATLTKGLSDAVLAAVAVLIGSFIAAAFADPFNEALFRVVVLVYGGYAVLVPGLIGLSSLRGELELLKSEFKHQSDQFRLVMDTNRIDSLIGGRVDSAIKRFDFWFTIAVIGYLLLAAAAVAAAVFVPDLIQ